MKLTTIINAWHHAQVMESDFFATDVVNRRRYERAERQVIKFGNYIDRAIEHLEIIRRYFVEQNNAMQDFGDKHNFIAGKDHAKAMIEYAEQGERQIALMEQRLNQQMDTAIDEIHRANLATIERDQARKWARAWKHAATGQYFATFDVLKTHHRVRTLWNVYCNDEDT